MKFHTTYKAEELHDALADGEKKVYWSPDYDSWTKPHAPVFLIQKGDPIQKVISSSVPAGALLHKFYIEG